MTDELTENHEVNGGVSRRLFAGLGAAAGASALMAALPGGHAAAGAPAGLAIPRPEVLGATNPALTYLPIDAVGFFTLSQTAPEGRYSDNVSGTGSLAGNRRITTSLPIPAGSVIHQINVAYQGQPIVDIQKRPFNAPNPPPMPFQQSLIASPGGAVTQTIDLTTPVTIDTAASYALQFFLTPGSSVYGVTVGYLPPTQSFIPFSGPVPRVLDTREVAAGKLNASEERVVDLGFAGVRGAVINLTVTDTEGAGFVAVFPANVAYAGNSSINWTTSGQNIANGVITATGPNASIKIRGGANRTHVVIDRIGWMV